MLVHKVLTSGFYLCMYVYIYIYVQLYSGNEKRLVSDKGFTSKQREKVIYG